MAPFKFLLSQSQPLRHYLRKPTSSSSSSLLHFSRTLCSSSSSETPDPPNPTPTPSQRQPLSIQPVSYPSKPKEAQTQTQIPPQRPLREQSYTREDFRYVKDVPNISQVTHPSGVAPLPGDVPRAEDSELDRERSRIDAERRDIMRRVMRTPEEETLPFPALIKVETTKKKKVFYDLKEAIQLVKSNAKANFVETLEAHVKLTPDLRRTDLKLTGSVQLPHGGTTKSIKVAAFAEGAAADEARAAGADIVGGQELIEGIKNGTVKIDFGMCFATNDMMVHMKQIAKYLKRLMPTAKNGSVTKEIGRAVKEVKGSSVLFKKDKTAIVHVGLGKVSFGEDALRENVAAFVNALLLAKPAGLKKSSKYAGYVESFHICSTMGPSYPVTIQSLSIAADRYNRLNKV